MKKNKIVGIAITIVSILWTLYYINKVYLYHFTDLLFFTMLPNYVLRINIILGVTMFILGVKTIKDNFKLNKAIIILVLAIVFGAVLEITAPL